MADIILDNIHGEIVVHPVLETHRWRVKTLEIRNTRLSTVRHRTSVVTTATIVHQLRLLVSVLLMGSKRNVVVKLALEILIHNHVHAKIMHVLSDLMNTLIIVARIT